MPRLYATRPVGIGSVTGLGAGFCACFSVPSYANPIGCGFVLGRGRGFRRMFYATGLPRWARFGANNANAAYFASYAE